MSPSLADLIAMSLKDMSTAVKASAFYPAQHPAVVTAFDRLVTGLREALAGLELLRITIAETVFLLDGKPLPGDDRVLSSLATYLSRRGLAALVLRPPLEVASIRGLVEVVTIDPATLRARGGPVRCLEEKRLAGVAIEEFDAGEALRSARTSDSAAGEAASPGVSWSDLMARFLLGQETATPPGAQHFMRRVAGDEAAARQLVASLRSLCGDSSPAARTQSMSQALGRIAAEVARSEPEAMASLARNLSIALSEAGAAESVEILNSTIPVPGSSIDLAREMRVQVPADRLGEMIVSLVRSQGKLTPRLTSVVRKVLIDSGGSDQQREALKSAIRSARPAGEDRLDEVWSSIEDLLEESEDRWLAREYKGFLELLVEKPPVLSEALRNELSSLPGFVEAFTESGIRKRAWLVFRDLLDLEQDPDRLATVLEEIRTRAARMDRSWYAAAAEMAGGVRGLIEGVGAAGATLSDAARQALDAIGSALVASSRREFHSLPAEDLEALRGALDVLGPYAVEPLLAGLEEEMDFEIRKAILALVASRGRAAVPGLTRRLAHPSWFVIRNVLVILGEIADPATIPAVAPTLAHPEPRVRRDAVAALAKIGGPQAFVLVRKCLDDPEVAEVATRSLASMDRQRTVATFLEMIGKVHLFERRNVHLKEAVKALGDLMAPEAIPRLREILLRDFWLPPSAGDGLRFAAARALERIGTIDAHRAIAQGARTWRRPVRCLCSEMAGGSMAPATARAAR